jgi:hypothetical protein
VVGGRPSTAWLAVRFGPDLLVGVAVAAEIGRPRRLAEPGWGPAGGACSLGRTDEYCLVGGSVGLGLATRTAVAAEARGPCRHGDCGGLGAKHATQELAWGVVRVALLAAAASPLGN